jgi:hypothetical protein
MFGSGILEVAIGLVFIYFILSLVCLTINESISALLNLRGKVLKRSLEELVGPDRADALYKDPFITRSARPPAAGTKQPSGKARVKRWPSYISPHGFALAMNRILEKTPATDKTTSPAQAEAAPDSAAQARTPPAPNQAFEHYEPVRSVVETARLGAAMTAEVASLEAWFNDAMKRVTGVYKRWSMLISGGLAVLVCVLGNVDTLALSNAFWRDPTARAAVTAAAAAQAGKSQQSDTTSVESKVIWLVELNKDLEKELQDVKLPLGWAIPKPSPGKDSTGLSVPGRTAPPPPVSDPDRRPQGWLAWLTKVIGLLISTAAVSMGAPFWFDLLQNLLKINLAGSGKNPEPAK